VGSKANSRCELNETGVGVPGELIYVRIRDHQREEDESANLLQGRSAAHDGRLQAAVFRLTLRVALQFSLVGWSSRFFSAFILRRSQPFPTPVPSKKSSGGGEFSTAGADLSNV